MGNSRKPSGGSRGGRAKGTPNKDKTALRAMTQEAVHQFTEMKRTEIIQKYADGWRWSPLGWVLPEEPVIGETISPALLDTLQPLVEEYDPVVELSLIAVNYENKPELRRQANADAAAFLRPKLKSIELIDDPRNQELQAQKNELAGKMVDILEAMSKAKSEKKKK